MMTCHKICLEELELENARLREALSLARSMILCGEKMSPRAEEQISGALGL